MPIYEFFCPDCNMLFSFLSRSVNTSARPDCPRCRRRKLSRQVSIFAAGRGGRSEGAEGGDEGGDLPIDDSRMESAVEQLAGEVEGISDDDPRKAAEVMRKFSRMTGLKFGERLEDALGRMESGEDPESIENDLGDEAGEDEEPFLFEGGKKKGGPARPPAPRRDPTLYEL